MKIEEIKNLSNEDIAGIIADITLNCSNFDKVVRFTLTFAEGLAVYRPIETEEIIKLWSKKDRRLKTGTSIKKLVVPPQKINPNGQAFIGRKQAEELIERNATILAIYGFEPL